MPQGVFIKTAESVALPLFQTLPDAPARIAGAAAAKEEGAGAGEAKAAGAAKAAGKPKAKKAAGSGKRAAAVAS